MGSRRIGLARTQALIQNLKRELELSGTALNNASFQGNALSTAGDGMQSGSVTAPVTRVADLNGEIVTTITLDLQGLSGSNGVQGTCVGNAEAAADGTAYAYIYQHSDALNGILYKTEISCIEDIAGGAANKDFDISGSTLGTYEHGDTPAGDPFTVYAMSGTISSGQTVGNNTTNSSDDAYFYLVNGTDGSHGGTAGQFTAGKLLIRFYGHKVF